MIDPFWSQIKIKLSKKKNIFGEKLWISYIIALKRLIVKKMTNLIKEKNSSKFY